MNNFNLLEKDVQQVLLGSILCDVSIDMSLGRWAYYVESKKIQHKEYLLWKSTIYNRNFATKLRYNNYKKFSSYTLRSRYTADIFKELYNIFYFNKRKYVTEQILDMLKLLGLAVWYMDDGYYNYGSSTPTSCVLCTHGFIYDENLLIKNWLLNKHKLDSYVAKDTTNHYYLVIRGKTSSTRFLHMIEHYVLPIFFYKLGHISTLNNNKFLQIKKRRSVTRKIYYLKNREKIYEYQKQYLKRKIVYH